MTDVLQSFDVAVLYFFNGFYTPYLDSLMWLISGKLTWVPMILVLIALLWRKGWKETLFMVLAIALTITIADQLTSGLIKPMVERLRPSHNPDLEATLHIVNGYRGGMYGFASSHAANSAGVAALIALIFKKRAVSSSMALWATLVCYSRVYEGVHYPGDIAVGAIIGVLVAVLVTLLWQRARTRWTDSGRLFNNTDSRIMTITIIANILALSILAIF